MFATHAFKFRSVLLDFANVLEYERCEGQTIQKEAEWIQFSGRPAWHDCDALRRAEPEYASSEDALERRPRILLFLYHLASNFLLGRNF